MQQLDQERYETNSKSDSNNVTGFSTPSFEDLRTAFIVALVTMFLSSLPNDHIGTTKLFPCSYNRVIEAFGVQF